MPAQAAILAPIPDMGRYLLFQLTAPSQAGACLSKLAAHVDGSQCLLGLGPQLVDTLGRTVPGLRDMPNFSTPKLTIAQTPTALLLWLRADDEDRGTLLHRGRALASVLAAAFALRHAVDAFSHRKGRDLTGFEDGTENPKGDEASAAALVSGQGNGLDGSSFLALQQWLHDLSAFDALGGEQQDFAVGRRRSDNQELDDAPASAHVKRTAQESFTPEAFVLRRSMPWTAGHRAGLMFAAFGHSFEAFEAQMRRMCGHEDGIVDGLFQFSKPISGAYFWCPPLRANGVDLSALGL